MDESKSNGKAYAVGDLRVWWIPQVPGKPFLVDVASVEEGVKIMDILALYDIHQFEQKVKPDYANAGGLQVFEATGGEDGGPGWESWYDAASGEDDPREYLASK